MEPLGSFSIFTNEIHTFGTDAVLLANFAASKTPKKLCDLCSGCGIIPLLMLKDETASEATFVEIQKDACELAEKSIEFNKVGDKTTVINSDLKDLKGKLEFGSFDLVTCNPPYKKANSGITNEKYETMIARHEILCNFDDICLAASRLLKFSGSFCVCHRPERLSDVICSMRQHNLEPKRLREVIQRKGEKAWLVLVEGKLGAKAGLSVLPPLYVEEDGSFSKEMIEIYGDYKEKYL